MTGSEHREALQDQRRAARTLAAAFHLDSAAQDQLQTDLAEAERLGYATPTDDPANLYGYRFDYPALRAHYGPDRLLAVCAQYDHTDQ